MSDRPTQSEHATQNEIRLGLLGKATMFRNNVGTAWIGDATKLKDGSILIRNPRILHAGLCAGSSDLIGWRSLTITPEMVGGRIAVFAALEVKSKTGRATAGQKNFCDRVIQAGGLAGIVKSLDDAKKALAID